MMCQDVNVEGLGAYRALKENLLHYRLLLSMISSSVN